jgi:phage-related protein
MRQDVLNFRVLFYSEDSKSSPVLDYLQKIFEQNFKFGAKALQSIIDLPFKYFHFDDIKVIKSGKQNYYELRVKSGTNICRFFFVIIEPNFVIFYGFTKKQQKTNSRDLKIGLKNLEDLSKNLNVIEVDLPNFFSK